MLTLPNNDERLPAYLLVEGHLKSRLQVASLLGVVTGVLAAIDGTHRLALLQVD